MTTNDANTSHPVRRIGFGEALRVWAKIGFLSFGGPAGQVALMHKELVEERRWIDEERFLHALNYCMLLPGPEAQQLATYIGWLMHRTRGGLAAGLLFVFPGFAAILVLSVVYAAFQRVPVVNALFFGLKAAVFALVVEAVLRIGKRALKTRPMVGVAAVAFLALFLFDAPFPLVVLAAALFGLLGSRFAPRLFPSPKAVDVAEADPTVIDLLARQGELAHTKPNAGRAVRILVTCLVLWAAPIAALGALLGWSSVWVEEGVFFSKTAVVTFGGAYAVLAYIAQRAVETYGWLKPGEMLDGLGLAETTPGPLIMVVQFVGFMGAYRNPGPFAPMVAGVLGSCITVWVTFVPCFLWILLGAPYIEALRGNRSLHAALSAITAAVVGVILNLTIWFGAHVVFGEVHERPLGMARLLVPVWSTVNVPAAVLAAAAMVAMFRFKVSALKVLGACAVAGVAWSLAAA